MGLCTQCLISYARGVRDSLRGVLVFYTLDTLTNNEKSRLAERRSELVAPKVATVLQQRRLAATGSVPAPKRSSDQRISKPRALNGLFSLMVLNITAVIVLHFVTSRLPSTVGRTIHRLISCFFFIVAKILSSIWFTDVANACLRYRGLQTPYLSVSRTAKDFFTATLLDLMLLLQTAAMSYVPVPFVSVLLSFLHTALLNALFSFEYIWMSLGFSLKRRVSQIEQNLPYFLGFGTILSLLTCLFDSVLLNGLLFGAFFPFFIVSTYMADKESYEQPIGLFIHVFGPSMAATSYFTGSLSATLKSWSRKRHISEQQQRGAASRIVLREHHSHSPLRDPHTKQPRHASYQSLQLPSSSTL